MNWIWLAIGDVVGLLALVVLYRTLSTLESTALFIDKTIAEIVPECQNIVSALNGVPALIETEQLTGAVPGLVGAYVGELTPLL